MRDAAMAAAVLVLCLPAGLASGQRQNAPPPRAAAPRYAAPQTRQQERQQFRQQYRQQLRQAPQGQYRQAPAQGRDQYGQAPQYQGRPQGNTFQRPQAGYPANSGGQRPAYTSPGEAPRGHLEDWLNQHRNVPVQDQERMLSNDPSFRHLAPADQQRLTQQLRQVDRMPEQQR